jgi:hypothetical protein
MQRMTFPDWCESAGYTYLHPSMKQALYECWQAAQVAAHERDAGVLEFHVAAHRENNKDPETGISPCIGPMPFCEDFGCHSLERFANIIRNLEVE